MFIGLFLYYLSSIQWILIDDNKIVTKNVFGLINKIEIRQIKKAYIDNLTIYSFRTFCIRKKYIVLSTNKSLVKAGIDAYNHKKKKCVVIPYSEACVNFIKEKYNLLTKNELNIK